MADILENAETDLTPRLRNLIDGLWSAWKLVEHQIEELNEELERISAADAGCTRIRKIPGIGPRRGHRQRCCVPQGARVRSVVRHRATSVLDRP
jgi:hypothetical protein